MKHIQQNNEDDLKLDAFTDLCKRMYERMEKDGSLEKLGEINQGKQNSDEFDSPKVLPK